MMMMMSHPSHFTPTPPNRTYLSSSPHLSSESLHVPPPPLYIIRPPPQSHSSLVYNIISCYSSALVKIFISLPPSSLSCDSLLSIFSNNKLPAKFFLYITCILFNYTNMLWTCIMYDTFHHPDINF